MEISVYKLLVFSYGILNISASTSGSFITKPFLENTTLYKSLKKVTMRAKKFTNVLYVLRNDVSRIDILTLFLITNTYKNNEKINMMIVPEFRKIVDNAPVIIKNGSKKAKKKSFVRIGTQGCKLEIVSQIYSKSKMPAPICPW